jgi:hypothetical protein
MHFDEAPGDRQPEAEPAERPRGSRFGLPEPLEDQRQHRRLDTRARIADVDDV